MADGQIVASGLTKQYKSLKAVDNLSFTVEPGRVTGFLGPNGAGKTTTLRMLLDLVTPTHGSATISGVRYRDLPDPARKVGAVLEASSAHRGRTARNHLRFIAAAAGLPASRVDQVLELVGLTQAAKRKFRGYSLGMRQRLGVAAALLGDPQVLILDEPANGLDPEGIRWMRQLLRHLATTGKTVLVSSHLLGEMEHLADDVLIIANGMLVSQGKVGDIISTNSSATVRVRTPKAEILAAALRSTGATVTGPATAEGVGSDLLLVQGSSTPAVGAAALAAGVELHELTTERADLEQAFLMLTQGQAGIR